MNSTNSATIAAIATPPGEGGIAVIRVSGPTALAVAARIFRPHRGGAPAQFPGYSVHYGQIVDSRTGETADDGLLTVFRAPNSYTGEDTIELSCHGGQATTGRILRLILEAGARSAEPGEFTQRAFLNGRLDLAQAEAVADIIRARTEAAQRVARRQLDGALSQSVRMLRDELIGILAAIEVTIDFSDEVGELEYAPLAKRLAQVRAGIENLLATADRGRILREGLRVALIGRPNVGKSSLFNALLRENRAIVTDQPGTTRDRLEETASIEGIPLVLVDVAGIRETTDIVERVGVERAEAALQESDVLLFLVDSTEGITAGDVAVAEKLADIAPVPLLLVLNKWDAILEPQRDLLVQEARKAAPINGITEEHNHPASNGRNLPASLQDRVKEIVPLSALTGEGIPELERTLLKIATGSGHAGLESAVSPESVVVSSARHKRALESALTSLREAERTTELRLPGDFIAIDARGALDSLGLITGETVTDDIVHRIFRDFCVGK